MKAWLRKIEVILTSTLFKKELKLSAGRDELEIEVSGYKYISTLKDSFVIKIYNLTYNEMLIINDGKFEGIEIKCGYESSGVHTIFKGQVLYLSNSPQDKTTNVVYLICCSKLLGLYNSKLNLSINSGINMYAALKFICERAGIKNSNVSTEFKTKVISETIKANGTCSSILDTLVSGNNSYYAQADSSYSSPVNIGDLYRKAARVISITEDKLILTNGYPQLTSDGLTITLLPTFNFMPGDVIEVPNYLLDMSLTSKQEVLDNPNIGYFVDKTNGVNGQYVIVQLSYKLTNRGSAYSVQLFAKSRSLYQNIVGGITNGK